MVVLAPRVGDITMDSGSGAPPLQYVELRMGTSLRPYVTPQTLLLGDDRTLVWQRRGALSEQDVESAIDVLETIR
jgi:hypothetical protein